MKQTPDTVEKIISDEQFLSWYFNSDPEKASLWEGRRNRGEIDPVILAEAIELMEHMRVQENSLPETQINRAEANLWDNIASLPQEMEEQPEIRSLSRIRKAIRVAAIVLVLALAGWMANLYFNPTITSIETDYGEIASNRLPDGSLITLNGNSSLRYQHPNLFYSSREVWIDGEGFFEVQSTPRKDKFTVHLGRLDVIVTGTQFNIYKRAHKTEILLTEGSILLKSASTGDLVPLQPGESATIENDKILRKTGNIPQITGWKDRKFIFENTSLEEVARSVEALYGIKVRIEGDTTSRKTISAILPADNLDIFLQSLEATQEFSIKKVGKEVFIGPAVR